MYQIKCGLVLKPVSKVTRNMLMPWLVYTGLTWVIVIFIILNVPELEVVQVGSPVAP
jgi:hypothetical protein